MSLWVIKIQKKLVYDLCGKRWRLQTSIRKTVSIQNLKKMAQFFQKSVTYTPLINQYGLSFINTKDQGTKSHCDIGGQCGAQEID